MPEYTPMIQQYLQIKANYPDAFLFFRLGDFYELFFEDAILASKVLEITLTGRAGGTEERIPMCGVPYHSSEQYIRKLIEKGYKVAICEQVETPQEAKGVVKREVLRVITPGTLVEQTMLKDKENNFILFIHTNGREFALLACDLSTGQLLGTENATFQAIVEEAIAFQAAEVIVNDGFSTEQITTIQLHVGVTVTQKSWDTTAGDWDTKTQEVTQGQALSTNLRLAFHFLFQYMHETQKRSIDHLQVFSYYVSGAYLALDPFSRRNLELTETIRDHARKGSLLWLVDETATAMGGRLVKQWLLRPMVQQREIEERLDAVEALMTHSFEREELRTLLEEVYDLERLAARISYGNVSPRDLLQLKKSLLAVPAILQTASGIGQAYLSQLLDGVSPCPALLNLLEQTIVEDAPLSIKDGGIFKEGYHEELDLLREAGRNGKQWLAELEARERQRTGIKSLKIGFNKVFGYYLEVTKSNLHLLKEGEYERKQTLANAERYITPELKEKEALILESSERCMELEYELFLDLRNQVNAYIGDIQALADRLARLDVLCSFARVSESYRYVRPSFSRDGSLHIKQGRHPVVERVVGEGRFVANDLLMRPEQSQILLITGPNMAGKSTYMRQLALIAIMAQMGCFVPADEATLPLFDHIFTRIGAADDLVGGQSTFMVEMVETQQAITKATPNSLILLDEIGRGTSTYDGISLAQSVVEYIHDEVHAKTLFSTHYHELTELEARLARLRNIHVACSEREGKVIFLHTVKEGRADRSYGIHVAELAAMPRQVLVRAQEILLELESKGQRDVKGGDPMLPLVSGEAERIAEKESMAKKAQPPLVKQQVGAYQETATAIKEARIAEEQVQQLALFGNEQESECLKLLEQLDLLSMTPLEALNTLFQLQQKLKGR